MNDIVAALVLTVAITVGTIIFEEAMKARARRRGWEEARRLFGVPDDELARRRRRRAQRKGAP